MVELLVGGFLKEPRQDRTQVRSLVGNSMGAFFMTGVLPHFPHARCMVTIAGAGMVDAVSNCRGRLDLGPAWPVGGTTRVWPGGTWFDVERGGFVNHVPPGTFCRLLPWLPSRGSQGLLPCGSPDMPKHRPRGFPSGSVLVGSSMGDGAGKAQEDVGRRSSDTGHRSRDGRADPVWSRAGFDEGVVLCR
jgi:hypothetical protein